MAVSPSLLSAINREIQEVPIREERELHRRMKRIEKLRKGVSSLNSWTDEAFLNLSEDSLTQLERNAKILRALEDTATH